MHEEAKHPYRLLINIYNIIHVVEIFFQHIKVGPPLFPE